MAVERAGGMTGLAYRRQFVLGPAGVRRAAGWEHHRVTDGLVLSVHPDLPCTRVEHEGRVLVLLGFVLDPRHPDRDDATILGEVLRSSASLPELLEAFDPLAGRWAAVHLVDDRVLVLHDPAGLRQVYHARDEEGGSWCGSSPSLLGGITGHSLDAAHLPDFVEEGAFRPGTRSWPGSSSAFEGISRLLPNHHLDLVTGEVTRYWPSAPIPPQEVDDAVEDCAEVLTGVMAAADARFDLALALTSGLDSRMLLAAALGAGLQPSCYTLRKVGMPSSHQDIRVPRRMLRELGLHHEVIRVRPLTDGPVADLVRATVHPFHTSTASQVVTLHRRPLRAGGTWVTVNGNVSEIARPILPLPEPTADNLARAAGMGHSGFAVEQLDAWRRAALPACEASGLDLWTLFYWEQDMGGWLASVRTEFDLVEEAVSPFNSRALLTQMLGVDLSLRRNPDWIFSHRLIAHLAPQLLEHPINPPPPRSLARRVARAIIRSVPRGGA